MPNLAAFLSYAIVTTFTPGPNNIMAMSNASVFGFKKSLPFYFGVSTGFFILFTLCGFFSATLFRFMPSIQPYMTYIGAAYILWLAWKTYTSKPGVNGGGRKTTNSYISGVLLQFVNPKGILYAITTVSTFIVPYFDPGFVYIGIAVFLCFLTFTSNCCWGLFGSVFQKLLIDKSKAINTVMALLLVYCAVSLF